MSAKKNGKANGTATTVAGPPYVLTEAEENDIRARYGFTEDSVDYEHKVCTAGLYDLEYELRAIAEQVFHARPDSADWSQDEARRYAADAAGYARSLCDIATRMMRYAGRLEAYADALDHHRSVDETVEAFRAGKMGGPPFTLSERRAEYEKARAAGKKWPAEGGVS